MISDVALKKTTKGLPASPTFPVAIPSTEQMMINPEIFPKKTCEHLKNVKMR